MIGYDPGGYGTGTKGGGSTGAIVLDLDWRKIDATLRPRALGIYKKAVNKAVKTAKELAPVDTGKLKKGIKGGAYIARNGDYVGFIKSTVPYGLVVESGSSRQPAQPHLHPARDQALSQLFTDLAGLLL